MHYYKFNIGDYASHTKSLSPTEDIAYRRLMDEYYLHEQPLIGCSTDVARSIGMRDYADDVAYILGRFFQNDGDIWRHKRIDREIEKYQAQLDAKSRAGKASAKARQAKASEQANNSSSTGDEQTLNSVEQTNNQEPVTINHKPLTKEPQKNKFSDDDMRCAEFLLTSLQKDLPDVKKPNLSAWANHVRLMRERDERTHRDICEVWRWARSDPFWQQNILSPSKLREKYDQLNAKMRSNHANQPGQAKSAIERFMAENYPESGQDDQRPVGGYDSVVWDQVD